MVRNEWKGMMIMKKKTAWLVALAAVAAGLAGCQPKTENSQPTATNDMMAPTNSMNTNSMGGVNK